MKPARPGSRKAFSIRVALLAGITTFSSILAPEPVLAWGGGCNCGAISAMHSSTRSNIRTHVTNQHNNTRNVIRNEHNETRTQIVNAIQLAAQQIIFALTQQSRENSNHLDRQVEAMKRIEDAAQVNAQDRMRQQFRAEAESGRFDPNPFACLLLDLFGSGGGTAGGAAAGSDVANQVARRISGDDPAVRAGGTTLSRRVVDDRDRFAGFRGSERASTDWSLIVERPTLDLSDAQTREVVNLIISNAIDATPLPEVTEAELRTPQGLDRAARREMILARQRASLESIGMSLNMRTPVMSDANAVRAFREMAESSSYNRDVPNRLSELQQLDIRTVHHYAPGVDRAREVAQMDERQILNEIWQVMAINTRIAYLHLELASRDAVVNALILASLNDSRQR